MMLLDPKVRGDRHHLTGLLHPEFVEFGASGRILERREIVSELVDSPDPGSLEVQDLDARWVSSDTVLVTYRTISAERSVLRSSWWLRGRDGWQIVFHQGTLTPSKSSFISGD